MIIAKRFKTNRELVTWLSNESALQKLEREYPRDMYAMRLNLRTRRVEINMRQLLHGKKD